MNNKNIKSVSFGCRLNALESEKIKNMLTSHVNSAVIINTCAVTAEAERQSGQSVRRIARENPNAPIFVTGCAATRNPEMFTNIANTVVVHNQDKLNLGAYIPNNVQIDAPNITSFTNTDSKLSKELRDSYPIVTDDTGEIIWIPGIKKSHFDMKKEKK